jgi:hypothetical protein
MATVNFYVPDEVKAEFDKVFGDEDSIIAELMRRAVRDRQLQNQTRTTLPAIERRTGEPAVAHRGGSPRSTSGRATLNVVLDASVALKWLLDDPASERDTEMPAVVEAAVRGALEILRQEHPAL